MIEPRNLVPYRFSSHCSRMTILARPEPFLDLVKKIDICLSLIHTKYSTPCFMLTQFYSHFLGETSITPLRIRFEDHVTPTENQETSIHTLVENEESAFEYIETVLLASDLNWDEFEERWISNAQILDQSLYEELQIFSSQPVCDQRLLFDSTNETLKQICDQYLGLFPELPFFKTNMYWIPKGMELINEVWKRIESRLNCVYLRSLDQLISNDMDISRMWMDLWLGTREIVMETEEWILEDLIDDTLLSLMDIN